MLDTRNSSGQPLTGSAWLDTHHRAKLPERRAFSEQLAALRPGRVVDLGCATGLWLDELDKVLPAGCEFIGLDFDTVALEEAERRARGWRRQARFARVDLSDPAPDIPEADLTLMFNLAAYLPELDALLGLLATMPGRTSIRQYDGAALRIGPMATEDRAMIDASLHASVGRSSQFQHYGLDRLYGAIERAPFRSKQVSFELFQRRTPFPPEFAGYFHGTMDWAMEHLSEAARQRFHQWLEARRADPAVPTYFFEVDVTAMLS